MPEAWATISSFLGTVVIAGGGGALIAFAVMRSAGEKWLQSKFDVRLAAFQHEKEKELEQVRFRVNSYFDRAVRLHQMEFEILPELWERLQAARNAILVLGSRVQTVEDLNRLSEPMLEELLRDSKLLEAQKDELRQSKDKTEYYRVARDWQRLLDCKTAFQEFRKYLARMGVFLDPELERQFKLVEDTIWDAIVEKELNLEINPLPRLMEKYDYLANEGDALVQKIKAIVQKGLRDSKSQ